MTRRTLWVSLFVKQTLADAALVSEHPVVAPETDALTDHRAVFRLNTRPVREKDEGFHTLDALTVLVHSAPACCDAVCCVEHDSATRTLEAAKPVT